MCPGGQASCISGLLKEGIQHSARPTRLHGPAQ